MLELLCGRSPPRPSPRGDSGRAVLCRPPCALHQRFLMLGVRSRAENIGGSLGFQNFDHRTAFGLTYDE